MNNRPAYIAIIAILFFIWASGLALAAGFIAVVVWAVWAILGAT